MCRRALADFTAERRTRLDAVAPVHSAPHTRVAFLDTNFFEATSPALTVTIVSRPGDALNAMWSGPDQDGVVLAPAGSERIYRVVADRHTVAVFT
jgi:hypothetical protein